MDNLKQYWLSTLRDKSTDQAQFQKAAHELGKIMITEVAEELPYSESTVDTPLAMAEGRRFPHRAVLVPILRSGLAMLPTFQKAFVGAPVGMIGMRRDEETAIAELYYLNLPKIEKTDRVILLDPMLATGGTLHFCLDCLTEAGVEQDKIFFCGFVSAPEGIARVKEAYPGVTLSIAAEDTELNADKFIVPGLGDFGDRYYGTT